MSTRFEVRRDNARERYVLADTRDGRDVGEDGGEPEDQLLIRDWSWVAVEMNKLDDELERLRTENADLRECVSGQAASEAAADAQRYLFAKDAEIARLREALKPFAALGAEMGELPHIDEAETWGLATKRSGEWLELKAPDLKRAAEVLK
jgi:hypothetical protein